MSDLISRQAMIDKMRWHRALFCKNRVEFMALPKDEKARVDEIDNCIADLVNAPSAKPKQKKGKWIIRYYDMETYEYKEKVYNYYEKIPEGDVYCSECKESALLNGHEESVFSNFCPHCGADMG